MPAEGSPCTIVHSLRPKTVLLFAKSCECGLLSDQSSKGSKQVALESGSNVLNFNDSSKVAGVAGGIRAEGTSIMTAGRLDTPGTRG